MIFKIGQKPFILTHLSLVKLYKRMQCIRDNSKFYLDLTLTKNKAELIFNTVFRLSGVSTTIDCPLTDCPANDNN